MTETLPDPIDARKHLSLSVRVKLDGIDVTNTVFHANVRRGFVQGWASVQSNRGHTILKHKKIRRYGVVTVEQKN